MRTCSTCAWWSREKENPPLNLRKCNYMEMYSDASYWEKETDIRVSLRPEYKDKKAFVEDGSSYYAELMTMPDFGCVAHEEIPK